MEKDKVSEAQAVLSKKKQEDIQKCTAEVQAVLEKYGMQAQAYAVIPTDRIQIVPKK